MTKKTKKKPIDYSGLIRQYNRGGHLFDSGGPTSPNTQSVVFTGDTTPDYLKFGSQYDPNMNKMIPMDVYNTQAIPQGQIKPLQTQNTVQAPEKLTATPAMQKQIQEGDKLKGLSGSLGSGMMGNVPYMGVATGALSIAGDVMNNLNAVGADKLTNQMSSTTKAGLAEEVESNKVQQQQNTNVGMAAASDAMKGAQAGMAFGPWGAVIGGVVGGAAGLVSSIIGNKKRDWQNTLAMNKQMAINNSQNAYINDMDIAGAKANNMLSLGGNLLRNTYATNSSYFDDGGYTAKVDSTYVAPSVTGYPQLRQAVQNNTANNLANQAKQATIGPVTQAVQDDWAEGRKAQFLYNNQHLWNMDPTFQVTNPQEAKMAFDMQKPEADLITTALTVAGPEVAGKGLTKLGRLAAEHSEWLNPVEALRNTAMRTIMRQTVGSGVRAEANRIGMGRLIGKTSGLIRDEMANRIAQATPDHFAYGGQFNNGLTFFNRGGSHEENLAGGIRQGSDKDGQPNLVEEGEVKWNDYIFSDRLKVPSQVSLINLPKDLANKTFADAAEKIGDESKERELDPISKRGLETNLKRLQALQEMVRGEDSSNIHSKGGGIHIKKANEGKFTASAKRAGQSVQQHAASVLANPHATALQKKRANFARNAAKWHHALGGNLFAGGGSASAGVSMGLGQGAELLGSFAHNDPAEFLKPLGTHNNVVSTNRSLNQATGFGATPAVSPYGNNSNFSKIIDSLSSGLNQMNNMMPNMGSMMGNKAQAPAVNTGGAATQPSTAINAAPVTTTPTPTTGGISHAKGGKLFAEGGTISLEDYKKFRGDKSGGNGDVIRSYLKSKGYSPEEIEDLLRSSGESRSAAQKILYGDTGHSIYAEDWANNKDWWDAISKARLAQLAPKGLGEVIGGKSTGDWNKTMEALDKAGFITIPKTKEEAKQRFEEADKATKPTKPVEEDWGTKNEKQQRDFFNKYGGDKSPVTYEQLRDAAEKYNLPLEWVLAQGALESGFGTLGKGAKTNNIFNVGNTTEGGTRNYEDWQAGIDSYMQLLRSRYTNQDGIFDMEYLLNNRVPSNRGGHYATDEKYTEKLRKALEEVGYTGGRYDTSGNISYNPEAKYTSSEPGGSSTAAAKEALPGVPTVGGYPASATGKMTEKEAADAKLNQEKWDYYKQQTAEANAKNDAKTKADQEARDKMLAQVDKENKQNELMRKAPIFGDAYNFIDTALSKPDHLQAQTIAAQKVQQKLPYNPIDSNYWLNQVVNQGNRGIQDVYNTSGGSGAIAQAGLLAQNAATQRAIGEALMQGSNFNFDRLAKVQDFNRQTDQFNSQQDLQAQQVNAQARTNASIWNMQAEAARRNAMRQGINALSGDIGKLGQERITENNAKVMYGYDQYGRPAYIVPGQQQAQATAPVTTVPVAGQQTTPQQNVVVPQVQPGAILPDNYGVATAAFGGRLGNWPPLLYRWHKRKIG